MDLNKSIGLIILLTGVSAIGHAQYANKPNNYYLEAGGAGGWGSVNYARHFGQQKRFAAHAGIGIFTENTATNKNFDYVTIPIGAKYFWPLRKDSTSFLTVGVGATRFENSRNLFGANKSPNDPAFVLFVPSFGYQRNEKNGIFWRITLSAFLGEAGNYPWLGLAIGFRK
jgi:hypothetical protein